VLCDSELRLHGLVLTVGHRVESLPWPRVVPVDGAAVDDARELPASISELISDRREGKDDVEVLSADLDEVGVDLVSVVSTIRFPGSGSHIIEDGDLLLWWEQVGDLTTVQQVVDVLQEGLLHDLGIGEQEYLREVVDGCTPE